MNLTRLEYFLAVVTHGTVTAAAREMHIAQPALSRQLKTLQKELRVTLFEPQGAGLSLTPAGRAFVPLARQLLAAARKTERSVTQLRTGRVEMLHVAATTASVRGFLADVVAESTTDDPAFVLHVAGHYELVELLDRDIDLVVSPVAPPAGYASELFVRFPLLAHVARDHPLAGEGRDSVTLAELSDLDLVLPSASTVSRMLLDTAATGENVGLVATFECDDGLSIQALAASGHGVGLTTEFGAYDTHAMRVLHRAGGEVIDMAMYVVWRPDHYAAWAIAEFAERVAAHTGGLTPPVG